MPDVVFEPRPEGGYYEIRYGEKGQETARFARAAVRAKRVGNSYLAVNHLGEWLETFAGNLDGIVFSNGIAPLPLAQHRAENREAVLQAYQQWQQWVGIVSALPTMTPPPSLAVRQAAQAEADAAKAALLGATLRWFGP